MKQSLNRSLIEITIRNAIRQIKDDSERNIRNLVDMALTFSNGRFQKFFFESAQTVLRNENSRYYKLISDLVFNVDAERIVNFGMNVGYNSFMAGARKIQQIVSKEHIVIPWFIALMLNGNDYLEHTNIYHSFIAQGMELGIYSWLIYSHDNIEYILDLAKAFKECAFVIFCPPDKIIPSLLDEANSIYNLMFAIRYCDTAADTCSLLRSRKFLYSVYHSYKENTEVHSLDEILNDTENMHAAFSLLYPSPYFYNGQSSVYQYILKQRYLQEYRTVPFDIIHDSHYINGIIAGQKCSALFLKKDTSTLFNGRTINTKSNILNNSLYEILKNLS